VLATLSRGAHRMFEFGTATGRTAYLWAVNSPPDARVHTLTLPPEAAGDYAAARGDSRRAATRALGESAYSRFRYTGTPAEAKVDQLYGDSKAFDETPYVGRCDLVFVDGSHAYSYLESDSAKALRMLAPGGICLWHDYRGRYGATRDVYRYLNRLARTLPLVKLRGTSLVAYRHPGG
jgi:predicted O-methyltransferase YrrM